MLDGSMIRRTSNRLKGWDYASVSAYFVTLVVKDRACIFGDVIDGEMWPSPIGSVIDESWLWLGEQYDHLKLDAYIVMPNHLHGIVMIDEDDEALNIGIENAVAIQSKPIPKKRKPLGRLIGAFKTVSTKRINELNSTPGASIWQRGFYDRIIRNEQELESVREYILGNPAKWDEDAENPTTIP